MAEGTLNEVIENGTTYGVKLPNHIYMERYSQQFTLAFIWSILFRIARDTNFVIIEYMNAICNGITVIAIYLICKELSKKYNVNKYLGIFMTLTFMAISALAVYIYGDVSSLAFALLSIYFIMRYVNSKKFRYALLSAICMAIAYMLRMNILIFIIAVVTYLFLDIISEKAKLNSVTIKTAVILGFCVVSMLPSIITKNYYTNKYNMNKKETFPAIGYFYMGMNETEAGSGWYNFRRASYAYYTDSQDSKKAYREGINERLNYFLHNPREMINFYIRKTASMWTENTYGAVIYNLSDTFISREHINRELDDKILLKESMVRTYQKALIFIIFGISIIVVLQNRKNISNEVLLLITIFIGGFAFHTLWEAKSRYIIPYIVVLIPVASIEINKLNLKEKIIKSLDKLKSIDKTK